MDMITQDELLDISSISLHYFCMKWIGATNENSNFDLRVYRVKFLMIFQSGHGVKAVKQISLFLNTVLTTAKKSPKTIKT